MSETVRRFWAFADKIGWVIAVVFVAIGFAVCYGQYRSVHDAQERHYSTAVVERRLQLQLEREIVVYLKDHRAR